MFSRCLSDPHQSFDIHDHAVSFMRMNSALVLFLDIDQCSIIGKDTNDILRVIFRMYKDQDKDEALQELTLRMVNKWIVEAVKQILVHEPNTHIVIYTQKANILKVMRNAGASMTAIEGSGNIFFEERPVDQGFKYIVTQSDSETPRVVEELSRLGLVTWAAATALGLNYLPGVVVTEGKKDLEVVARELNVDPERAFLFDDHAETHIALLDTDYAAEHMIPVQPFDFTTICEEQARELLEVLNREFPFYGIKEQHAGLFNQIVNDPSWPMESQSLNRDEEWVVYYPRGETMEPSSAMEHSARFGCSEAVV